MYSQHGISNLHFEIVFTNLKVVLHLHWYFTSYIECISINKTLPPINKLLVVISVLLVLVIDRSFEVLALLTDIPRSVITVSHDLRDLIEQWPVVWTVVLLRAQLPFSNLCLKNITSTRVNIRFRCLCLKYSLLFDILN